MVPDSRSLLITEMTWPEIREHLDHDTRLIVPVGACDQYGPHLPLGAATSIAEKFAERLSREFDVLRAPAVPYGVNVPTERSFAGTASVREKTLHAFLNDLVASWEDTGFSEFILMSVHTYDPHVEAIATATSVNVRVRVIELLGMDLSEHLAGGGVPEHGGEILTSLMLYLYPTRVRMEQAVTFHSAAGGRRNRQIQRIPDGCSGAIGDPTAATADTGRRLYEHIYEKIRTRVFEPND